MNDKYYEFIIIGSGIGGGLLTTELSKNNKNVLLLEAGDLLNLLILIMLVYIEMIQVMLN